MNDRSNPVSAADVLLLQRFHDGELSDEAAAALRSRLDAEPALQARLREFEGVSACFRAAGTGETTALIDALRRIPEEERDSTVAGCYDGYLNGLYRSLKQWRRGNTLGGRLEAAQAADALLHLLFALEGRWRPYSSRLHLHLHELAPLGWQPDELREVLLDLITTGAPGRQQRGK